MSRFRPTNNQRKQTKMGTDSTQQDNGRGPELARADGSAFRWAYAAVCALAVKLLDEDNKICGKNWPAGQSWNDLSGSSKSIFLHRARDLAGIPHDAFLAVVRADSDAIEDIYEAGRLPQNIA